MSQTLIENEFCPNCETLLQGEFCFVCGQKRIHHPETVGHFTRHFFDDLTHFDSLFLGSLIQLIFKPGFLTKEYNAGRRASYINPIRLYLFLSFFYFFLFFTFSKSDNPIKINDDEQLTTQNAINQHNIITTIKDSIKAHSPELFDLNDSLKNNLAVLDGSADTIKYNSTVINLYPLSKYDLDTMTLEKYTTTEAKLKTEDRDGVVLSFLVKKQFFINTKYNGKKDELWKDLTDLFLHNIPKMLFFLIPVFALLLKLLYLGSNLLYVTHAVFSLHYFSFLFITSSVYFLLEKMFSSYDFGLILFGLTEFYLYKAMHNFYNQKRFKTVSKFFILHFVFFIVLLFSFLLNLAITFINLS